MPSFAYKAINSNGEVVKGLVEGNHLDSAYESITSTGLNIVDIKQSRNVMSAYMKSFSGWGIKTADVIEFANNMSVMLKAGLALTTSINDIAYGMENKRFASRLEEISRTVELGSSFSVALSQYKSIFPELFINLVAVGEETGSLGDSLSDIAVHLQRMEDMRSAIVRAMMYPAFALVGTAGALLFWLIYVLPKMTGLFISMAMDLPPLTKALIAASDFSRAYWYIYIIIPVSVYVFIKLLTKNEKTLYYLDAVKLKLPVLKLILYNKLLALFAEQLRILIAAGITIDKSFDIMIKVVENSVFRKVLLEIRADIMVGSDISAAMKKHDNLFPNMVIRMMAIGESTGNLYGQLNHLSEYYLKKLDDISQKMGKLIEPLIIVFVGGMFLVIILGLLAPIYDLISQVG
jgi:general secretion pathway protein F/type IV pilus assembly protein PilC